jgi:hypothetical protein
VLRDFATPRIIRVELRVETITHATALAARACGLETVLPSSNGLHILAARVMSDASLSVEFDKIAQKEVDDFNKAVEAFSRDGSLPHECCFTELSRRMLIIRDVSQCKHVYSGWRNISKLVETWADRDLWEACVKKETAQKASSASCPSGRASSGMFMFQRVG